MFFIILCHKIRKNYFTYSKSIEHRVTLNMYIDIKNIL
jgi:hypothetical protein